VVRAAALRARPLPARREQSRPEPPVSPELVQRGLPASALARAPQASVLAPPVPQASVRPQVQEVSVLQPALAQVQAPSVVR